MKASAVLLIAMLVLAVVIIVYALARDPTWAGHDSAGLAPARDRSPWAIYRQSDGTFDAPARQALARVAARPAPTPAERLLAATIITNNVINRHNPTEVGPRHPTPAALARTRERGALFEQARQHFIAALDDTAVPPAQAALLAPGTETLLDAAVGFAFGGMGALLANDPLMLRFIADDWAVEAFNDPEANDLLLFVDRPIAHRAGRLRDDVIAARRAAALRAGGGAPGAAVDAYVALATQHVDDDQNVHDPSVQACEKAIVGRLRAAQGPLERTPTVDKIIEDIAAHGDQLSRDTNLRSPQPRPERVADALAVAARTKAGERVQSVGATDEECLRRVWLRADDPRNAQVRDKMRAAVFDGLVDSWETPPGSPGRQIMCVNGRTSHLLGALATLDHDKRNWAIERLEHFKNAIYAQTRVVIDAEAQKALASGDRALENAGKLYLATTPAEVAAIGAVPDEATERLVAQMKAAIGEMVDAYVAGLDKNLGAEAVVPAYMVATIKAEAQAAAG